MRETEIEYWVNGHTVHGRSFHIFCLSIGHYGALIGLEPRWGNWKPVIKLYRLVSMTRLGGY